MYLLLSLLAMALPGLATEETWTLHRYWPQMPRPRKLVVVTVGGHEEGMVFETAAGLAARALRRGESHVLLFEDVQNSGYQRWFALMRRQVAPHVEGPVDVWTAVRMLHEMGVVCGYILYRYDTNQRGFHELGPIDESANVATSLATVLSGVAVSEGLQPKAEAIGLPMILDARNCTEAWCLETYGEHFNTKLLMTADPKSRVARSMAVALQAFVVSRPGATYEAALAHCEPDSPVLGWGCGDEKAQTLPSTEWGLFQTATNWCHNLPAFSTEAVGQTIPRKCLSLPRRCRRSLRDIKWQTGVHYATIIMSDGDNVQWLMGNFAGGPEGHYYYESPVRGEFPFGWTVPYVDLAQLCPYTLMHLFEQATPNDDFVLFGGGYYYPDQFGVKRQADCLRLHAQRIGEYMRFGRLRSLALNALDWDSPQAQAAYDTFAREIPALDGIFVVQYYPYSGGEGRILWAKGVGGVVPVVSCRLTIWANTGRPRDTTPARVAAWLNSMLTGGPTWSAQNFSFVMAHCWSRFRNTHGDESLSAEEQIAPEVPPEEISRGLLPVKWMVDRLDSHVRVVTPSEFLLLMRLHLRTRETLREYFTHLRPLVEASPSRRAKELLTEAEAILPSVHDADSSGRRCFRFLQRADRLMSRRRAG